MGADFSDNRCPLAAARGIDWVGAGGWEQGDQCPGHRKGPGGVGSSDLECKGVASGWW